MSGEPSDLWVTVVYGSDGRYRSDKSSVPAAAFPVSFPCLIRIPTRPTLLRVGERTEIKIRAWNRGLPFRPTRHRGPPVRPRCQPPMTRVAGIPRRHPSARARSWTSTSTSTTRTRGRSIRWHSLPARRRSRSRSRRLPPLCGSLKTEPSMHLL